MVHAVNPLKGDRQDDFKKLPDDKSHERCGKERNPHRPVLADAVKAHDYPAIACGSGSAKGFPLASVENCTTFLSFCAS